MTADPPRVGDTITTIKQLDALPVGSVVRERDIGPFLGIETIPGTFEKFPNHLGWHVVAGHGDRTGEIDYPATVLYVPGEQPPFIEDARAESRRRYPNSAALANVFTRGAEWAASRAVPSDQPIEVPLCQCPHCRSHRAASQPVVPSDPPSQSCTYCGGTYPAPVALHHAQEECVPSDQGESIVCMTYPDCDREHAGGAGGVPVHPPVGAIIGGDEPAVPSDHTATTEATIERIRDAIERVPKIGPNAIYEAELLSVLHDALAGLLATARPDTTTEPPEPSCPDCGSTWALPVSPTLGGEPVNLCGGCHRVNLRTAWTEAGRCWTTPSASDRPRRPPLDPPGVLH